jgi:hypothetical protein
MEVAAATVSGLAILLLLLAWRLSQDEPLRLESLTPYLESALQPADGSYAVRIGETLLTWAGWDRTLDLRVAAVRVLDAERRVVATIPEASITLSIRALLLRGMVAPTAIELFRPRLTILREADGEFRMLQEEQQIASAVDTPTAPILPQFFDRLAKSAEKDQPTAFLERVGIIDGALTLVDRRSGITWTIPDADLGLRRTDDGLQGNLLLAIDRLGEPARLNAAILYNAEAGSIVLDGDFYGVKAGPLALVDPRLALLRGFAMTFDGSIATSFTADGKLGDGRLELNGGAGTAMLRGEMDAPLVIRQARFVGTLSANDDRLTLDEATLVLDGPVLKATGTLTAAQAGLMQPEPADLGPDMKLELHFLGTNVPVGPLNRYWPRNAGANARDWVTENMSAGLVEKMEADIALDVPGADWTKVEVAEFVGTMQAKGLTIHYLRPLPPIEAAAGIANFTHREFAVDFTAGSLQGLHVTGGRLVIGDLDKPDQTIDIQGRVVGSLAAALTLLDHPRLGYVSKLGVDPKAAEGNAEVELGFRFPAERDLTFDKIELSATGKLTQVGIAKAMLDQDFTEGDLKLTLDKSAMTIAGKGKFAGAPIALEWRESFGGGKHLRRIAAQGSVDSAQRRALGVDYSPYVDGPLDADIVYTLLPKRRATVAAKLDLTPSAMALEMLSWRKEPGVPGAASFEMDLVDGRIAAIRDLAMAAGDLAVDGRAEFAPETGKIARMDFARFNLGRSRIHDVAADWSAGYPDIVIGGGEFDAGPLLEPAAPETAAETPTPAFALRADRLDKVYLSRDRAFSDVTVGLRHDGEWWDLIDLKGTVPNAGPLTIRYAPTGDGRHALNVASADAGAVLAAFGITESVRNGQLLLNAQTQDADPRRPLKGVMEIKDFRVVDAPVLARLLSVATLTGFVDLLGGEGFQFDKFKGEFTKTGGRLDIALARARGPSIGITAAGHVDFDENRVDLAGTVVPANALNSVLSEIPLLGPLIVGEGLFAVTYGAEGDLQNPDISINPLSALAPGFVKGLFEYSTDDGEPPPPIEALPPGGQK